MNKIGLTPGVVGNEFVVPQPRIRISIPVTAAESAGAGFSEPIPVNIRPAAVEQSNETFADKRFPLATQALDLMHGHSLITFAVLFLIVGSAAVKVGSGYLSEQVVSNVKPTSVASLSGHTIAGLNLTVDSSQLDSKLQSIASQPVTFSVGDNKVSVDQGTIKTWIKVTPSSDKTKDYLRVDPIAIKTSLTAVANKYAVAPVDQVTVTHPDGSSAVILAGQNGTKLSDLNTIQAQIAEQAKTIMNGSGLKFSTPLVTQNFAAVTPAAFPKLIEVNVNTKQMFLYDNGQLTRSYAISAGKPTTPTPLGEFHIWEKLPLQTMRGINPDGSPYVQPNVRWINYFDHRGDAVHGNYWRPLSWFGVINSSHGCVSLPDNEAEWVYNWTTIGTTIINHA